MSWKYSYGCFMGLRKQELRLDKLYFDYLETCSERK